MMSFGGTAFADAVDSYVTDTDSKTITISGSPQGCGNYDFISFALLKKPVDEIDVTPEGLEEGLVTCLQLNAGEGGAYSVDISMEGLAAGYYTIRLRCEDQLYENEIYYFTDTARQEVIREITSKKSVSELREYLDLANEKSVPVKVLELSEPAVFMADDEELCSILFDFLKDYDTPGQQEMTELIHTAGVLAALNGNKIAVRDYSDFLTLDPEFLKYYDERLSEKAKNEFTARYMKNLQTAEDAQNAFCDGVILSLVNTAEKTSDVAFVVQEFKNRLIPNSSQFDSLSTGKKYKIYESIAGTNAFTIAELKKRIAIEVEAAVKPPDKSGSGNKGGGGGGGSSRSPAKSVEISPEARGSVTLDEIAPLCSFSDMDGFAWAAEAVGTLNKLGIVSGVGDGRFAPEKEVTREDLVKMLVLAVEKAGGNVESEQEITFADVNPGEWYYDFVKRAYAAGIIMGLDAATFGTGQSVTRQDAAVMLVRAAELCDIEFSADMDDHFADEDNISDYARYSVQLLKGEGIVAGVGDGNFLPLAVCTRAQIGKMIYEAFALD